MKQFIGPGNLKGRHSEHKQQICFGSHELTSINISRASCAEVSSCAFRALPIPASISGVIAWNLSRSDCDSRHCAKTSKLCVKILHAWLHYMPRTGHLTATLTANSDSAS